jgi:hypothetical protein
MWRASYMGRSTQSMVDKMINIGDVFIDKKMRWSYYPHVIYLVLSADLNREIGCEVYQCAQFVWSGSGFMGAQIRQFTVEEVLIMESIGSIKSIKSFEE